MPPALVAALPPTWQEPCQSQHNPQEYAHRQETEERDGETHAADTEMNDLCTEVEGHDEPTLIQVLHQLLQHDARLHLRASPLRPAHRLPQANRP